jgi:hypothetical protein
MIARRICSLAVVAWLCAMILAVPLAMADETTESFIVYTDKEEYLVGEVVRIYVKAEAIDPDQTITVENITVYDPANNIVAEWHNLSIVLTDTETSVYLDSIIAETEGTYTVYAEGTGCPWVLRFIWCFFCWRKWKRNVVPEVPYGTVIATVTLLGATGLYIRQKKHPKIIKL